MDSQNVGISFQNYFVLSSIIGSHNLGIKFFIQKIVEVQKPLTQDQNAYLRLNTCVVACEISSELFVE